MRVSYIRHKAFATNSSSTHTPVIVSGKLPEDYLVEDCQFGWDHFVAASEDAKRKYIGTALYTVLTSELNIQEELACSIVRDWAKTEFKGGYIDHDSLPMIPLTFDGKLPHRGFFEDALKWYLNPQLVMLGGSDDGERMDYESYGTPVEKVIPEEVYNVRCRKDPKGFYTLFSGRSGTKTRMSFDDSVDMSVSSAPELVDLKITNYCTEGCHFCYQDSTPRGDHADKYHLYRIIRELKELEVFEIAIGGGEPTSHPHFWEILEDIHGQGIIPNFTTRNLAWMKTPELVEKVRRCCGGFAYSIDGYDEESKINGFAEALIKCDLKGKGTIQHVLMPDAYPWEVERLVDAARHWKIPVTLLGFKKVGRGSTYRGRRDVGKGTLDWKKILKGGGVSCDTALVQKHKEDLVAAGVAKWSMDIAEGAHSMYIDAVSHKIGPSSFCGEDEYVKYRADLTKHRIVGTFETFTAGAKGKKE
jgi:rRNA maturation protein Nop10